MRRWFVTLMLLLAPALVTAQSHDLVGKRIRATLAGPEGPWVIGVVSEAHLAGVVLGSALFGGLVGSGLGPREKVVLQMSCP